MPKAQETGKQLNEKKEFQNEKRGIYDEKSYQKKDSCLSGK